MSKIRWKDEKQTVEFVPVFIIGFEEEFERGVIMTTPAYKILDEAEPDFALYAIDAAVDILMQRRDEIEKRELH
jgi:hypothetical protein